MFGSIGNIDCFLRSCFDRPLLALSEHIYEGYCNCLVISSEIHSQAATSTSISTFISPTVAISCAFTISFTNKMGEYKINQLIVIEYCKANNTHQILDGLYYQALMIKNGDALWLGLPHSLNIYIYDYICIYIYKKSTSPPMPRHEHQCFDLWRGEICGSFEWHRRGMWLGIATIFLRRRAHESGISWDKYGINRL